MVPYRRRETEMKVPDNVRLFTINEFSKICGMSRSTLIRMEECGYLTPHTTDPNSGYRYYDVVNVTEVAQYTALQTLGLSRGEIADCFTQKSNIKELINEQKGRISRMQRILEEFEIRFDKKENYSFSYIDLPETVCYCKESGTSTAEESEMVFYHIAEECILAGFHISPEPLFGTSSDDFKNGIIPLSPSVVIKNYIPVEPSDIKNPNLVHLPATRVFSLLAYGDYSIIGNICIKFWNEVEKRKIRPTGPARFMGLIAPFAGRNISPSDFCYRMVVPIGEE